MREIINLNNNWFFNKTAEVPNVLPSDWESVTLPHTWNALDGQDGGNDYWRGTAMYCKRFSLPENLKDKVVVLEFQGVAMTANVYLNGKQVAHHEGGYSAFRVDITDFLNWGDLENLLCVSADNSDNTRVYPQKADFTFYGGIIRDVNLIVVPQNHFELIKDATPAIKVTPVVNLEAHTAVVTVETWQTGEGDVEISIGEDSSVKTKTVLSENGHAKVEFLLEPVHLWNGLEDPYLYTAKATFGGDEISTRFGCRKIEIDAQKGFLLNGKSYPLRGVAAHQDHQGTGSAAIAEKIAEDVDLMLDIGANTVRLAHYQHPQSMYDLCDEKGIVVWAEIPYISMHMKDGMANTLSQMKELIVQNYNHPCIAVWGLSNEITAASAVTDELLENHRQLNALAHNLDASRNTTMANVFMLDTSSPILAIPNVNSYNLYFGWYLGELDQNDAFFDSFHEKYPDRAIGLAEYGADANPAFQSAKPEKGDYTESYQCVYHEHMAKMISARPWLWATHVWNMFDFAADGRDEGGKHGVNQKGLVTFDRKLKKDAYYLYKAYWSKHPFVHICGQRYVDRVEAETEIKVYSNLPEVSLFVDGKHLETKKEDKVFIFHVAISGKHVIDAKASGLVEGSACDFADSITIQKVATPNPAYSMPNRQEVNNWFDGELDETCWSIKDNMAQAMADPKVGPIMKQMMDKAASSRGDVATAVKDNPALVAMMQRAMQRMTIEGMLKQAGADTESMKQLNRILQGIHK
jgi:beta-galactosidase